MPRKTKEELAELRAKAAPRPSHAPGSELHRFSYNHPKRGDDPDIDAVCIRCGLEEVDVTTSSKQRTVRWRWPGTVELAKSKPACLPKATP